ncbi:Uncharacterized protein YR821_2803 [Yersinia ruckeri]|nr:hypothetical protein yruck0001_4160 [Yersinia ruckeri ATCC 29473]QTD77720.1 Uncharacterized protein YR821_2803 [Yersinia ruckeri]
MLLSIVTFFLPKKTNTQFTLVPKLTELAHIVKNTDKRKNLKEVFIETTS